MTRDLGQLHQVLRGWELVERHGTSYRITDELRRAVGELGGLGAIYGLFRSDPWSGRDWSSGVVPEARAEVAAMVQDEVRSASGGTGVLLVAEAPHGDMSLGSVTLPVNLAQAATWSPELVREAYDAVGRQIRADGQHLALISGLDMLRDPRWGRSEETFGESPLLAARLTAAQVTGLQGGEQLHPASHPGAVVKHLAAQGAASGGRNGASAVLGPVEMAEVHLTPVQAAVRAGAVGFMAAYNDIDGTPCVASPELLTGTLRHRYGFEGVVMADALAVDRLAENLGPARAADAAMSAGCDLNLGDDCWSALTPGEATERALGRVHRLKQRFGLTAGATEQRPEPPSPGAVRRASTALSEAAITSLGPLPEPLSPTARVLVTGPFAQEPQSLLGDYVPVTAVGESLAAALGRRVPDLTHAAWGDPLLPQLAARADVVVVQLGGTSQRQWDQSFVPTGATDAAAGRLLASCGEGLDVADLRLPHGQDDGLRALRRTARRLIGVAVMGRPHILATAKELCDDLLLAWYPGPSGADAIVRVLLGELIPTGRLPVTLLTDPGAVGWTDDERVGTVDPVWLDALDPVMARLGSGGGDLPDSKVQWSATGDGVAVTMGFEARRPGTVTVQLFGTRRGGSRWPRRRILLDFARIDHPAGGSSFPSVLRASRHDLFEGPAADGATSVELMVEPFGHRTTLIRDEGA